MKRNLLFSALAFIITLFVHEAYSQSWDYDFGTGTGVYNTNNSASTTFLPAPFSGTARVRRSNNQGGEFELHNPTVPDGFGSGSNLRFSAANGGSVNKFSIYEFDGSQIISIRFNVVFGNNIGGDNVTSGNIYFFLGKGAIYSDNNAFSGAQVFTGIRFAFNADGTTVVMARRDAGNWLETNFIGGNTIDQGTEYMFEVFANNSTSAKFYDNGNHSVASNKYDLWINGLKVLDNANKALLAAETDLVSFMFYGESSTGNAANIFLDDFTINSDISFPVRFSHIAAKAEGRQVHVDWATAAERNTHYMVVERSTSEREWSDIGRQESAGFSSETKRYIYTDKNPAPGVNYYRIRQVDRDGSSSYSRIVSAMVQRDRRSLELFPAAAENSLEVSFGRSVDNGRLHIYDLQGQVLQSYVLAPGIDILRIDLSGLMPGNYIAVYIDGDETVNARFVKL